MKMLFSTSTLRCNNWSQSFLKMPVIAHSVRSVRDKHLSITSWMMSQRISKMNSIAKSILYCLRILSLCICVLQEWNHCWATVYANYVYRLHGGLLFCTTLYTHTSQEISVGILWFSHFIDVDSLLTYTVNVTCQFVVIDKSPLTKEEVHVFARVCLSVCLLARLLKNACMDFDAMFARCQDMDELITFWVRSGS